MYNVIETTWKIVLFLGALCLFSTAMIALHADHSVKGVHMASSDNYKGQVCVWNNRNWDFDDIIYCGDASTALQLYGILKGFSQVHGQQPQASVVTSEQ